jgi:hypothetical protein
VSLGVAIDVAIGMIFVYLLLGMLASAVQELVAGVLKLRGRQLRTGLMNMLSGLTATGGADTTLFQAVFGHSLVQGHTTSKLPTYVSGTNFSLALLDALTDGSQGPLFSQVERTVAALPAGSAKDSLTALLMRTGGDLDKLQASIQTWFDDAMDRVSGEYRRFTQYFTLAFGLIIALGLNIDSIEIAKTLWTSHDSRAAIVALAEKSVANDPSTANASVTEQAKKINDDLGSIIPIGWSSDKTFLGAIQAKFDGTSQTFLAIVGWLITAIAVSLGAPFWFDMLKNLINLRNAGPQPARSDSGSSGDKS